MGPVTGGLVHGQEPRMSTVKQRLRDLYEGDTDGAHRFRYGLLVFDVATILFIGVSSFMPRASLVEGLDVLIGLAVLTDFVARFSIARNPWRELLRLTCVHWRSSCPLARPCCGPPPVSRRCLRTFSRQASPDGKGPPNAVPFRPRVRMGSTASEVVRRPVSPKRRRDGGTGSRRLPLQTRCRPG